MAFFLSYEPQSNQRKNYKFLKSYKPPVGHALIFPANWCFPHTGTVVTKGKKRVAVTWYHCKDHNVSGSK